MRTEQAQGLATGQHTIVFDIRRYLTGGWYVPVALVAHREGSGKLGYTAQYATTATIGAYGFTETPVLSKLFDIVGRLTETALQERFSPPKRAPKPLPDLLQQPDVKSVVEKYVHRQMDQFLRLAKEHGFAMTFQSEKKSPLEDMRVWFAETEIRPHLIFRRTPTGVRYRLNFTTDSERWLVRWKRVLPLTNHPGWLLVEDKLYPLPELNGYLVKPFLQQDEIMVPNHLVRSYFQKFVMRAVEKTEIEAEGFDITTTRRMEGCELSLVRHLFDDRWLLGVRFHYAGASFQQYDSRLFRTALHIGEEEEIRIAQVKRDPDKEERYLASLREIGLRQGEGHLWEWDGEDAKSGEAGGEEDAALFAAIGWLSDHRAALEVAGFRLADLQVGERQYCLQPATLEQSLHQENDWFDLQVTLRIGEHVLPFAALVPNIREGNRLYQLPDGMVFVIPSEWMARFREVAHLGEVVGEAIRLTKSQRPLLPALGLDAQGAEPAAEMPFTVPSLLRANLRPYQLEGVKWLVRHYHENLGACLADDMGLGKTLQTLAVLLHARERLLAAARPKKQARPGQQELFDQEDCFPLRTLILLPASLVFNWDLEIRKFAPGLTICRHSGPQRTRDVRILSRYDIVLSTYQTARQDMPLLRTIAWEYVILDESQYIKNPQSAVFKALGSLNARHRISLSGTPIENSLSDLWAQMQFLNPGMLGTFPYFRKHFILPIEKKGDEQKKAALRTLVEPYLLRRTKEEVAPDLPPLSQQVFYVEMSPTQASLYEREKSAVRNQLLQLGDPALPGNRLAVLAALTRLRQLCNHPALIDVPDTGSAGFAPVDPSEETVESAKFTDVLEYWDKVRKSGHKVLIFSFFEKFLQLFRSHFDREGLPYAWLTGSVGAADRERAVASFSEDPRIQAFFITTKAGGTGLNLTAADYVFLLDPWWNPFVENQAIARAHRLGRTEKVVAVRFIARDTVEEKILRLQERKSQLAAEFLSAPEDLFLSRDNLEELLR